MKEDKALIPRPTARAMAIAYKEACRQVDQAFNSLKQADIALNEAFIGVNSYYGNFFPYRLNAHSAADVKKEIKKTCWHRIIELMELPSFMPARKKEALYAQVDNANTPEITQQSILDFCANIYSGLGDLFAEMVEDTARWLQPGSWDKYITNKASKFEIADKVIKTWMMEESYGKATAHIRYGGQEDSLQTLDNVFSLLDGKGVAKYPGNLITAIKEAAGAGEWEAKTEYFRVKWFRNGNLHIWFLRKDLLKEFNKIAGKGKIKSTEKGNT